MMGIEVRPRQGPGEMGPFPYSPAPFTSLDVKVVVLHFPLQYVQRFPALWLLHSSTLTLAIAFL